MGSLAHNIAKPDQRPLDPRIGVILATLKNGACLARHTQKALFIGGPIEINHVILLARSDQGEVLERMIEAKSPENAYRVYSGFAGWANRQLENEIDRGDWRIVSANTGAIFDDNPTTIWNNIITALSRQWI